MHVAYPDFKLSQSTEPPAATPGGCDGAEPAELANSSARNPLGELPELLTAMMMSPGSAKFLSCSANTHS